MSYNWRKGQLRGANMIDPMFQRMESRDGSRWALGRNVKRALGDHRFDAVEVWTLKRRIDGKVFTVATHVGRDEARRWIGEEDA